MINHDKYEILQMKDHLDESSSNDLFTKEWLFSKALLNDDYYQFVSLVASFENTDDYLDKLKQLLTFEPNLDLLCTAAKHCKKDITKLLLETYKFDPNKLSNDGTPLHWLVKSNYISILDTQILTNKNEKSESFKSFQETFNHLIYFNADINAKDSKGYTPLHYAAMQDNYGAALLILNSRIHMDKEETDLHGMTALHIALRYGSENVAILLIDRMNKENLSTVDKNKMLALHHACKCKIEKVNIVEKILQKANKIYDQTSLIELLNKQDKFNNTMLNLAVKENHLNIVELLVKTNKAFKNIRDHDGNLPIHTNAKNGSIEVFDILFKYDFITFDVNNQWENVFHIAAYGNKYKFIIKMLDYCERNFLYKDEVKLAVNAYNKDGLTPLMCAITSGGNECIEIFIKNQSKQFSVTMLMFDVCIEYNQMDTLKYLLSIDENVFDEYNIKRDFSNNTILHLACIHKNVRIFKLLIDYILEGKLPIELIDSRNQNDESCFFIACKNGCFEIVEYLLNIRVSKKFHNYDPLNDRDDENSTPLHLAAKTNHLHILELLIENSADVNAKDKYDKIPLHYSCQIGSFEIMSILVEYRSKINSKDIFNKTPLDYSCDLGHNEIVAFLLENGAAVHDINDEHYNCLDIAIENDHKAVVETLIKDKNFNNFVYFHGEKIKNSKIKKMIKKMPLTMKVLLDNCYDLENQKYNFQLIDNPRYRATIDHPLWIISHYQFKYLLGHETVKKLLELKMKKWPRLFFWIDLLLYFLFLMVLTVYNLNMSIKHSNAVSNKNFSELDSLNYSINTTNAFNSTNFNLIETTHTKVSLWPLPVHLKINNKAVKVLFTIYEIFFGFLLFIYMLKKMFQIYNYKIKMFLSIKHWLEIFCFVFNILSLLPFEQAWASFGSLSVLFGWIGFSFYFQSFGAFKLGSYSVALRETIQNSFKLLPFFFMIYFGFLCSFKIRESFGVSYHSNTITQITKTMTMMIGEIEVDNMGIESNFINNLIFIFFLFIMCIIVLDLFIGIEVGEIKRVIDEAETENVAMNLKHVLKVQEILYQICLFFRPSQQPTFMNFKEYCIQKSDKLSDLGKRPDLLNRVENYLVTLSHTVDQNSSEHKKQMRELKEETEFITQQLEQIRKKVFSINNKPKNLINSFKSNNSKNFDEHYASSFSLGKLQGSKVNHQVSSFSHNDMNKSSRTSGIINTNQTQV